MISQDHKRELQNRIAGHKGPGIITGMVEYAEAADLVPFQAIFGSGCDFQLRFNLYFHWYNLIHELGHIARRAARLGYVDTTPVMEEKLANDFAVAYWRQYGRPDRLVALRQLVTHALGQIGASCPQADLLNYYRDTARFQKASQNPKEYGCIQFCLVLKALEEIQHGFRQELQHQGFSLHPTAGQIDARELETHTEMQAIVDDAVSVLRFHGVELGRVQVFPHYNLNEQRAI